MGDSAEATPAVVGLGGVSWVSAIGPSMAAGVPEQVALVKNENVAVPVGVAKPTVPVTIALSWIGVLAGMVVPVMSWWAALWTSVLMEAAHCWKAPSVKSFSTAVIDCDERVSTRNVGKHSPPRPKAVRFKPPSKKLTGGYWPEGPDLGV